MPASLGFFLRREEAGSHRIFGQGSLFLTQIQYTNVHEIQTDDARVPTQASWQGPQRDVGRHL